MNQKRTSKKTFATISFPIDEQGNLYKFQIQTGRSTNARRVPKYVADLWMKSGRPIITFEGKKKEQRILVPVNNRWYTRVYPPIKKKTIPTRDTITTYNVPYYMLANASASTASVTYSTLSDLTTSIYDLV
jgi:hypothetical protein